jgi:hypothetical protein
VGQLVVRVTCLLDEAEPAAPQTYQTDPPLARKAHVSELTPESSLDYDGNVPMRMSR